MCDSEYFFDNEQNTCSKCDDAFKSQSLWTALLVLLLIFAAYMAWKKSLKDETRKVLLKVFRKTKQKINTLAIMLQIATAISVNLSIYFPIAFAKFLGAFNILNLNPFQVVAFGCMGAFNVSFYRCIFSNVNSIKDVEATFHASHAVSLVFSTSTTMKCSA